MSGNFNADHLRPVECVCEPDPRCEAFATLDEEGVFRALTLADYHAAAYSVTLTTSVPDKVVTQFETAKNLYLYSWFVYRFFPVAEHQALSCLEYGLRERYVGETPETFGRNGNKPTLRPLLRYAVERGDIRNEGFEVWHHRAKVQSRHRYMMEKLEQMKEQGLTELSFDESDAEVLDVDRDWDYVNVLIETLPAIRNNYAHGGSTLHAGVLATLQIVAECLNQIY